MCTCLCYNVVSALQLHVSFIFVELQRHRPPMPRSNRLFVPPSFSSTSGTDLLEKELKECEISFAQRNAYQEVLIKVSNSLDTEQVHKLCCFSEEVSLNGRDNLNATTLIRLFEQKALISPASLEYLWLRLHTIGQSDLCGLIEQYARTYLDGQPALQPQGKLQYSVDKYKIVATFFIM